MTGLQRMCLPGVWFVFVALGVYLTIMPQLKMLDRIEAQEATFSAAARHDVNEPDEFTKLALKLDDIRTTAQHKIKSIPVRGDVAGLIRDLTEELDRRGVSEHEIATGVADEIGGVFSIPMSINLTGSFLGIYGSIDWLEAMPRLVRILRLKIEKPGRSVSEQLKASNSIVKAELLINVYYDPAELDAQVSLTDAEGSSP